MLCSLSEVDLKVKTHHAGANNKRQSKSHARHAIYMGAATKKKHDSRVPRAQIATTLASIKEKRCFSRATSPSHLGNQHHCRHVATCSTCCTACSTAVHVTAIAAAFTVPVTLRYPHILHVAARSSLGPKMVSLKNVAGTETHVA